MSGDLVPARDPPATVENPRSRPLFRRPRVMPAVEKRRDGFATKLRSAHTQGARHLAPAWRVGSPRVPFEAGHRPSGQRASCQPGEASIDSGATPEAAFT